jgi:hypothetical protein
MGLEDSIPRRSAKKLALKFISNYLALERFKPCYNGTMSEAVDVVIKKTAIIPIVMTEFKSVEQTSQMEARKVMFGDVTITEDLTNRIPSEEFEQYEKDFSIFKSLVNEAQNEDEKAFLSSRYAFRSVMGMEPESSFFPNEASVLYNALKRAGAKDNFTLFVGGKYETDISFIHLRSAERVLQQMNEALGIKLPDRPLSNQEISLKVMNLFNQKDTRAVQIATGLLSGFPVDAVTYWVNKVTPDQLARSQWFLRPLKPQEESFLFSQSPVILDKERIGKVYPRPFLTFGEKAMDVNLKDVRISGFGTDFVSPNPPPESVTIYMQKILEIDRRLEVTTYIDSLR